LGSVREKVNKISKTSCPARVSAVLLIVVIVLLIVVCISSIMRTNMHGKYSSARNEMREQLYLQLQNMTSLFAHIDDPEVDVQHKLIPYMREAYTAAVSLNTALKEGYGERNALLSDDQVASLDAAFEEYASAYRSGGPTGLAEADLKECMAFIQPIVDERFLQPTPDPNILVVPNTPVP